MGGKANRENVNRENELILKYTHYNNTPKEFLIIRICNIYEKTLRYIIAIY